MSNEANGGATDNATAHPNEWGSFLVLAFLGLPIFMTLAIAAYGFIVWFMQILFLGPPS